VDFSTNPVSSDRIISVVNGNPDSTWRAGYNSRFENMTVADARALMGARVEDIASLPSIQHNATTLKAAPASFDPRVSRKSCTGPVLDQAFCGSCWAFGATEAISDRLCISKGDGATFLQLSPLDMTSCDSGFFSMENGCQGGQLGGAWNYAKKTGLVTEKCFPYLKANGGPVPTCSPDAEPCLPESKFIKTPKCTKTCADGSDWSGDKHKLKTVYNVPASQLMAELANNGPVESAFSVYSDFVHYKDGVYSHQTGSMLGGHAIKIIGYGTQSGTPYWLVQNSWTTTWGDGGYFKIKRGNNECGIESQAVAGSF
jgi:cathepsin B